MEIREEEVPEEVRRYVEEEVRVFLDEHRELDKKDLPKTSEILREGRDWSRDEEDTPQYVCDVSINLSAQQAARLTSCWDYERASERVPSLIGFIHSNG